MLSVPEPLPNDPEAVVTALETAEIFGKQGDLKEAVRWVRRAAEIAGDEGSDERALTLARAVADLNISASQPPQPPPPLPQAAAATTAASDDPDADAETRVVDSRAALEEYEKRSQGSNGAAAAAAAAAAAETAPTFAADAPPPPPPPPPPAQEAVETAPAPETYPTDDATPASRRGIGSMAELLARKEAEVSSARAAAEAALPADTSWDDPPPPPPQPSTAPQPSVPPVERRTARPAGERIPTPLIPSAPIERVALNAPIHQAVRASVVATAEPGVFVLRVLTADQAPAPTAHEVLVVVTNPTSSPFK